MNWYLKVIKQYADFKGRARRKEYWMFVLINGLISFALGFLDGIIGLAQKGFGISTLYNLVVLIPAIAVAVRRAHDVGKSGWFMLIPFYNLYLAVSEGDEGENEYGPNPKNPNSELNEIGAA